MTMNERSTTCGLSKMLANGKEKRVLSIWSIAGHVKGEVDHFSSVAKISIKRVISNDFFFY